MKKLLVLVLAIAMLCSVFVGCSGKTESTDAAEPTSQAEKAESNETTDKTSDDTSSSEETVSQPIKISYAMASFESLDPYYTTGHTMVIMGYCLYEYLWTVDEDGNEIGYLAKDYTVDGSSIDVEIYDNIYDQAGNHITASDVAFSYNEAFASGKQRNAKYWTSVEATGEYTVHMEMTIEPYVTLLSGTRVAIVSEAAYTAADADFVNNPIGTGHYTVKEFVSGTKAVFEKADSHWTDDDPSLVPYLFQANPDEVEFDVILESQQIQTALETNTIQCGAINATIAEAFEGNADVGVVSVPGNYAHTIMLNCLDGPFADNLALRQAVCYAIDTASISQAVTKGTGHPAYTVGMENLKGYNSAWESEDYYDYNVEKAKELMAEAGYPDGGITLRWLGKNEEFVGLTAQIIQANLAELGIELEIQSLDNTTYMNNRPAGSKTWDLCWGDSVPKGNFVLAYQSYCDITLYEYGNMEGLYDENLQDLLLDALYGQTAEQIDALHYYVKDLAFIYGSYVDFNFYGTAPGVTMTFANDGEPIPNAFVFADDYSVFVD